MTTPVGPVSGVGSYETGNRFAVQPKAKQPEVTVPCQPVFDAQILPGATPKPVPGPVEHGNGNHGSCGHSSCGGG